MIADNTLLWIVKKLAMRSNRPVSVAPANLPTSVLGGVPGNRSAIHSWRASAATASTAMAPFQIRESTPRP